MVVLLDRASLGYGQDCSTVVLLMVYNLQDAPQPMTAALPGPGHGAGSAQPTGGMLSIAVQHQVMGTLYIRFCSPSAAAPEQLLKSKPS